MRKGESQKGDAQTACLSFMSGSDGPLESVRVLTTGPKVIPFRRESRDTEKTKFFAT